MAPPPLFQKLMGSIPGRVVFFSVISRGKRERASKKNSVKMGSYRSAEAIAHARRIMAGIWPGYVLLTQVHLGSRPTHVLPKTLSIDEIVRVGVLRTAKSNRSSCPDERWIVHLMRYVPLYNQLRGKDGVGERRVYIGTAETTGRPE